MAIHEYDTHLTRTHRFTCPAPSGNGVAAEDVQKAISAAEQKYRLLHDLKPDEPISGSDLRITGTEEDVTVFFTQTIREDTRSA